MAHSRLTEAMLVIREELATPGVDLTLTIPADYGIEKESVEV